MTRRIEKRASGRLVLGALFLAVVAFAVQQSAIVPAVQTVQQELRSSPELAAWLVTLYLIVATVATPAMGRLGDLYGRRRLLLVGLAVFAAASVGAALAPSMVVLIAFRAVQGVGGAVYPLALALGRENTSDGRSDAATALLATGFGVGTAVGFTTGGLFAGLASWRWIFVVGAVLVAAAFVVSLLVVPRERGRASGGFDGRGLLALSTSAGALLVALTLAVPLGWASPWTVALLAVALAAGVTWYGLERRTPDPLIDLHVLRNRPVLITNLATVAIGWGLFGPELLLPRFVTAHPAQVGYGLGHGAVGAGLLLLPLALGQTVAAPLAERAARRWSPRAVFVVGLAAMTGGLGFLALVRTSQPAVVACVAALGVGVGIALESTSAVVTSAVDADVAAASSALNSTIRRLAGGVGGQVNTILVATLVVSGMHPAFAVFRIGFLVSAALTLAAAAGVLLAGSPTNGRTT